MEQKLAWLRPSRVSGSLMGLDVRSYGTAGWATGNPSRWRFPVTSMMDRCSNAREKGGVVTQV